MKKQLDIKKLLVLNLPYILMGLFATNFGEGWRMAVGADASAKMLSFFTTLPKALASWWPSLHPLDLIVGLCCGAGLRLAVYLKSKNAKKYRHGMEYGSARCATTLCTMSNTPMTMFQVLVTMRIAAALLNTHLKIIQVSTSCRLFRSVII